MSDDVRVALADDQPLLRAGFRLLIDNTPGLVCVGEAATGLEAVEVARRERPDVILMDVRMPEMNGIEATRLICQSNAGLHTRVLVLTTFDLDEYVFGAIRAGASGFLLKEVLPGDLINAIKVVAAGEALLTPGATRRLIEVADTGGEPADGGASARMGNGRGLINLRERLAVYGGTLECGPALPGGFRVTARIPWRTS
jgi:DNA-binding NarL/FixJ family response regulator